MRTSRPKKFFSQVLLLVMLTVMVNCLHNSVHAMTSHGTTESDRTVPSDCGATHHCPASPCEQHDEYDGCDTGGCCAGHAPLIARQLTCKYNPCMLELQPSDPFTLPPEVFLSKFIPPQILA